MMWVRASGVIFEVLWSYERKRKYKKVIFPDFPRFFAILAVTDSVSIFF